MLACNINFNSTEMYILIVTINFSFVSFELITLILIARKAYIPLCVSEMSQKLGYSTLNYTRCPVKLKVCQQILI